MLYVGTKPLPSELFNSISGTIINGSYLLIAPYTSSYLLIAPYTSYERTGHTPSTCNLHILFTTQLTNPHHVLQSVLSNSKLVYSV